MESKFRFEFTEQELNTIFKALQELPFKEVVGTINSVNRQINEQQMAEQQMIERESQQMNLELEESGSTS